jgi:hypothetical protein
MRLLLESMPGGILRLPGKKYQAKNQRVFVELGSKYRF